MISAAHNKLVQSLDSEAFYSSILKVDLNGQSQDVVLKDLQRHPSKPFIMHFDLLRVSGTDRIKMFVPFHFLGEDVAPGVKAGGTISHHQAGTEIVCEAQDLPEYIEIDVSGMEMGDTIYLSEVQLPKGAELAAQTEDYDAAVVGVHAAKVAEEEDLSETGEEADIGEASTETED